MRGVGKLLCLVILYAWDGDLEVDAEVEALVVLAQVNAGTDGGILGIYALVLGHCLERGVVAGGVTGSEELLGVGALTAAAPSPLGRSW